MIQQFSEPVMKLGKWNAEKETNCKYGFNLTLRKENSKHITIFLAVWQFQRTVTSCVCTTTDEQHLPVHQ